jgi:hypothetical protein
MGRTLSFPPAKTGVVEEGLRRIEETSFEGGGSGRPPRRALSSGKFNKSTFNAT